MKAVATPLMIAALMATHAYAECHLHAAAVPADVPGKRMLRMTDDTFTSIIPDAMVLGSTRSKNRLIAVSTADDDAAVMTTMAKATSRATDQQEISGGDDETESLLGDDPLTSGASAVLTKNTMTVRSDATKDTATMAKTGATVVRADAGDQK